MSNIEMICSSCSKQKKNLNLKRSALIRGTPLYLCNDCQAQGYEPRYIIVLAIRQNGLDVAREYLLKNRYVQGAKGPILASELL